jgi:hypothetical protein
MIAIEGAEHIERVPDRTDEGAQRLALSLGSDRLGSLRICSAPMLLDQEPAEPASMPITPPPWR